MNKIAVSLVPFLSAKLIIWILKASSEKSVVMNDYAWVKIRFIKKKKVVAHHLFFPNGVI